MPKITVFVFGDPQIALAPATLSGKKVHMIVPLQLFAYRHFQVKTLKAATAFRLVGIGLRSPHVNNLFMPT